MFNKKSGNTFKTFNFIVGQQYKQFFFPLAVGNADCFDQLVFTLNLLDNLYAYRTTSILVFSNEHRLKIAPHDPKSKFKNRNLLKINPLKNKRSRRAQNRTKFSHIAVLVKDLEK